MFVTAGVRKPSHFTFADTPAGCNSGSLVNSSLPPTEAKKLYPQGGGLLDCERKNCLTSVGIISARISGNLRADKTGTKKLQQVEAQGAMDFVLSHGAASGGQQSGICRETDI